MPGIHKIRHVVVIMQENRSFDSYFGTFPGADGIPMRDGRPSVCAPNPVTHGCDHPYHDSRDRNVGGPHGPDAAATDIAHGRMNGYVEAARATRPIVRPAARRVPLSRVVRKYGCHGVPRRTGNSELLALRPVVRNSGPHVRAEPRLEPAHASCARLGVVRAL